jgi:regulator of cell morphogenesis and NO signaling
VREIQKEDLVAGKDLNLFRNLTDNYELPGDVCESYKNLFKKMKEFETDLVFHLDLENNVLFPKLLALDNK